VAALRSAEAAALRALEEEWKQTSAARKTIGYTIQEHQARQHAEVSAAALAA